MTTVWQREELDALKVNEIRDLAGGMRYRRDANKRDMITWILKYAPVRPADWDTRKRDTALKGVGVHPPTSVRIPVDVKERARERGRREGADLTAIIVALLEAYGDERIGLSP